MVKNTERTGTELDVRPVNTKKDPARQIADIYGAGRIYPNGRPKVAPAPQVVDEASKEGRGGSGLAHPEPGDLQAPRYDNRTSGWLRGQSKGGGCDRPWFDKSPARKNDRPISKGGENSSRNPFSSANNAASAESDWNSSYKPTKYRG